MTRLSARLPESHGLDTIADDLIQGRMSVLLAVVDSEHYETNTHTGEQIPTARILRLEVIDPDDLQAADQMIRRALERRTGNAVLPIDLENELKAAFDGIDISIDPDTND